MEYEPKIKNLIKKIVRKFYEPHHIVIVDLILEEILLYDTDLIQKMKMHPKEVNKLIVTLKEDKIIKYENKVEIKEDNRQYLRTVYYINYVEVRDVIKYKIFKITRNLERSIKSSNIEGYICTECEKEFSSLDAQCLMSNYVFKCDDCKGDLVENIKDQNEDSKMFTKFMNSIQDIIDLLKELDKYDIPSMDYFQLSEYKKERQKIEIEIIPAKIEPLIEMNEDANFNTEYDNIIGMEKGEDTNKDKKTIDEFVYVCGEKKKFSDVTDEDKEKMNEEEYEKYFDIFYKYQDEIENS